MRIIAGKAKGRKLKMVPGETTRPITDRVKENLFNILGDWVIGTRWLDLFAGTGQVGIEALSRGAVFVFFVDSAWPAIRTIRENLEHSGLGAGAQIVRTDAFAFLQRVTDEPFDVVYVAPPQYQNLWEAVVRLVDSQATTHITSAGMVIVQIDPKEYRDLDLKQLALFDQRRYGRTMLCFYELDEVTEI
jgi:16S rRNA (guanine966-N2)-methyltransferase